MGTMEKLRKQNALVLLTKLLWRYSEGGRPLVLVYAIMQICARTISLVGQPYVWSQIYAEVEQHGAHLTSSDRLETLLWYTLGIEVLVWLFHGPARIIEQANAFMVRANYRSQMMEGLLMLPLEWHTDHHSADTIDRVKDGTQALYRFSEDSFEIITAITRLVESYILIVYFNLVSSVIMFAMLAVGFAITIYCDTILLPLYDIIEAVENYVTEKISDNLANITTILCLSYERSVFASMVKAILKSRDEMKTSVLWNELKWCLNQMCCALTTIIVCRIYIHFHQGTERGLVLSEVFLLTQYLGNIGATFFTFTDRYSGMVKKKALVLRCEELTVDFREENLANHVLPKDWKELLIEDMEFTYADGSETPHLTVPRFSLKRRERVACVGNSGGGKTTFAMLVRGMRRPQKLKLSADRAEIKEGFAGISRAIALAPQAPETFASTIRSNLTFDVEPEPGRMEKALEVSCFGEVVDALPKGLETSLKEKGVNLSGGQRQRLGIARALLVAMGEEKDIIVLDEPTASMDKIVEAEFYRNLFAGFPDQAIVAVLHSVHLAHLFDSIRVFHKGRLIATGTYDELIEACPEFIALCKAGEQRQEPKLIVAEAN